MSRLAHWDHIGQPGRVKLRFSHHSVTRDVLALHLKVTLPSCRWRRIKRLVYCICHLGDVRWLEEYFEFSWAKGRRLVKYLFTANVLSPGYELVIE